MSYYSEIDFTPSNNEPSNLEPKDSKSGMLLVSLGKPQINNEPCLTKSYKLDSKITSLNEPVEKQKPKNKFIEKESPNDFWLSNEKSIDDESKLKKAQITSKNKVMLQPAMQSSQYCNNKSMEAGRGFGNLNISNDIRYGGSSRMDTKEFKEKQESRQMLDFHFQYLDKDYQNPNHIVMPIPRGGDMTRKQKSATNENPSDRSLDKQVVSKKISFDYS